MRLIRIRRLILPILFLISNSITHISPTIADSGTEEIPELGFLSWTWELKERSTIRWDISSSDRINLYISTRDEYISATNFGLFRTYERERDVISTSGSYQVPFSDRWVLFLFNENMNTIKVQYDVTNSGPPFIFTLDGVLIIVGIVLLLFLISVGYRARTKRKITKIGASRPLFCEFCGERVYTTERHCPACRRPIDYSKLIVQYSDR